MSTATSTSQFEQQSDLQAAFQLFSEMSGQLEQSYRELEQRVEQLTDELATARTEKHKQLAEKEKLADQLAALHQALPVAVIWIDQHQLVRSTNPYADEIFKQSIRHENWQQIIEDYFSIDGHELVSGDGKIFSYQQQSLEQQQGQVVILTDLTLSRQLQQNSFRQQRLAELGEITAGIAHQVRTPLASALISLEQLAHPAIDASMRNKSIERIKQNLMHLDKFVNDMLLYARGGEFDQNCISVALLLHNLDVYVQQKKYPHFTFKIENPLHAEADMIVAGSGDALLSVLIGLIENASQLASEQQPVAVTMKLHADNSKVVMSVIDNGPGLSASECEQVFKPFYTTRKQGTGLGLAISKSIIQAHQGELTVHSEKGKGTEMRISLNRFNTDHFLKSGRR